MRRKQDRSFVFKLFDISKHLRGSGTADKIKKFRRDVPRGFLLTSAVNSHLSLRLRWLSTAAVSKNPLGNPSRYSLLYYLPPDVARGT